MIKRMTLLISIVILIAAQAYADETTDETTEMLFSSPLLYSPIIHNVLANGNLRLNKRQPTKIPEFSVQMEIDRKLLTDKDKESFDECMQMSFKEIPNTKFLLFKEKGFLQQLHVLKIEQEHTSIIKHKRDLDLLLSRIKHDNHAYRLKTKDTLISLLKQDDFLADFPCGEHILKIDLKLLQDVAIGNVYCYDRLFCHKFCFYKMVMENSAMHNLKTNTLVFAITFRNGYINLASIFDNNSLNGFECYFYPNQGLKYLTSLKNGKQEDVTLWDMDGGNEMKMSFNEWAKKIQSNFNKK